MVSAATHGRWADRPTRIPFEGWKDILWRVWKRLGRDRIGLIAAGTTFYLILALFPALAAFVSLYGLFADPHSIAGLLDTVRGVLPAAAADLIGTQLGSLVSQDSGTLSFGFITGLVVALWSADNGVKTLFEAMNVAYAEEEKRSFIRLNLLALGATLGLMLVASITIVAVGIVPAVLSLVGFRGSAVTWMLATLRWPLLLLVAIAATNILYRYGPSRRRAKWRWVTWGSAFAAVGWLVASLGFSWYLSNFANYNATYGSLGAVIGFLMWTWISVYVLIIGAELDAELEHQTRRDSTIGPERPMGQRGAVMADTVGAARGEQTALARQPQSPALPKPGNPDAVPGPGS